MSRTIPLTQGFEALVSDQDYSYLMQWKWSYVKGRNGGYAKRHGARPNRNAIALHNVVAHRKGIHGEADHKNQDTLDNQRCNLRPATRSQNSMNRSRRRDNRSGYKGVDKNKGQWRARITKQGRTLHLGYFKTKKKAAAAYNAAAIRLHGEFSCLNRGVT